MGKYQISSYVKNLFAIVRCVPRIFNYINSFKLSMLKLEYLNLLFVTINICYQLIIDILALEASCR